ncbi:hypothetical protein TNCV_2115891 [Trichonephila clavipes]|nr:hypothetical protein TNCV_2115891 [Trichonephila clavipes]
MGYDRAIQKGLPGKMWPEGRRLNITHLDYNTLRGCYHGYQTGDCIVLGDKFSEKSYRQGTIEKYLDSTLLEISIKLYKGPLRTKSNQLRSEFNLVC